GLAQVAAVDRRGATGDVAGRVPLSDAPMHRADREHQMSTVTTPTILASTMQTPIGPLTILSADERVCAGGFTDDIDLLATFVGRRLRGLPIEVADDLGST